jgi:hypothetical protein
MAGGFPLVGYIGGGSGRSVIIAPEGLVDTEE